jgi:very-short-patch-repair endonuclease
MIHSRIINESKHLHGADLNIKSKARLLRKNMTDAEKILWEKLRNRQLKGLYFRRQHPYGIFILDFFCHEINLAIEVDGDIHLDQLQYDADRSEFLESTGITVIRFSNMEVENNMDYVLEKILSVASPSPLGEGLGRG